MLKDPTVTKGRSREQSQAPEARDVVPTLAPKMPKVNMLAGAPERSPAGACCSQEG